MSRPRSYEDALSTDCPTRDLLDRIGSRWASLVLVALAEGPLGHRELLRRIDGVSQKMLTQTLRDLERAGLVSFDRLGTNPPRSRYALTDLGRSLHALLRTMITWADSRADEILLAQQNYDAAHGGSEPVNLRTSAWPGREPASAFLPSHPDACHRPG